MQVNVQNTEFCFVIIMVILLLIFYNIHPGGVLAGGGDQVAATCPASIIRTAESYTAAARGGTGRHRHPSNDIIHLHYIEGLLSDLKACGLDCNRG